MDPLDVVDKDYVLLRHPAEVMAEVRKYDGDLQAHSLKKCWHEC